MHNTTPYARPTRPQFHLLSLLGLMTLLCAVFAVLGALGISIGHLVSAFVVIGSVVLITAGAVELVYIAAGLRNGRYN